MQDKLIQPQIFTKLFLVITIVGITCGVSSMFIKRAYNDSASMPIGNYITFPVLKPSVGNTYTICLSPNQKAHLAVMYKLGLRYGDCNNGYMSLLKKIVAVPGDTVSVTHTGITINDKLIANSQSTQQFNRISLLPLPIGYTHKLLDDEYFAMGIESRSYDSRYFGVISRTEITSRAIFIR